MQAPDVHNISGSYYLYYQRTVVGTQESNISLATSSDLESWTDLGLVDLPPETAARNYNRIDANLLSVDDGADLYLSFGSFFADIWQVKLLTPTTVNTNDFAHLELNTTDYPFNATYTGNDPSEGSYQFYWEGSYYLFWSSGNCCNSTQFVPLGDEYKVMVCKSDSPSGEFLDRDGASCLTENGGTQILGTHDNIYAPGGQGVLYDDSVQSVILYYHYCKCPSFVNGQLLKLISVPYNNQTGSAQFGWNCMDFDNEGWPKVKRCSNNSPTSTASTTSTSTSTFSSWPWVSSIGTSSPSGTWDPVRSSQSSLPWSTIATVPTATYSADPWPSNFSIVKQGSPTAGSGCAPRRRRS